MRKPTKRNGKPSTPHSLHVKFTAEEYEAFCRMAEINLRSATQHLKWCAMEEAKRAALSSKALRTIHERESEQEVQA